MAILWAIVRLLTNLWMIGDILSDAFTTAKYYQHDGDLFVAAVFIWFLTPLNYSRVILQNLFMMFFNMDGYNRKNDNRKRWSVLFLSALCLTPEKVNSIHICLKLMIWLSPFVILLIMMIFGYSIFLAYILYPVFAIKTAINDVCVAASKTCKSKFQTAEEKYQKNFCGMQFMTQEDELTMKSYEVFYEAFPQATLAMMSKRASSDEDWFVFTICMSMGSIIFTSVGYYVHSGKLMYGNDIFKRPCSIIGIVWRTHYCCFSCSFILLVSCCILFIVVFYPSIILLSFFSSFEI